LEDVEKLYGIKELFLNLVKLVTGINKSTKLYNDIDTVCKVNEVINKHPSPVSNVRFSTYVIAMYVVIEYFVVY
jgi:hypothetical protein